MKRSLRVTLLSILISLTLFTVFAVGISGYLNLDSATEELTDEVLRQTAGRVEQRVEELIRTAHRQSDIMLHLFRSGAFDPEDFPRLAGYWNEVVDSVPMMSGMSFVRASDGTGVFVMRSPVHNRITVREALLTPRGRRLHTYTLNKGRKDSEREEPMTLDVRTLPGFVAGRDADSAAWTDTFMFFGEEGELTYPGLSFVRPVRREDGSLRGVLGVSFNVFTLCDFLHELDVSTKGYAFIIEQSRDGKRRLIAHPRGEQIFDQRPDARQGVHTELRPLDAVSDANVLAFMKHVPATADVHTLPELTRVSFRSEGENYLGAFRGLGTAQQSPRWIIGIVLPEHEIRGDASKHLRFSIVLAVAVLMIALLLSFWTAGQVATPLEELVRNVEKVARLDLEPSQAGRSVISEVDRLACATEDMKTSLRSFRKYVPADLVARLIASGKEAALGGERRRLTIYFSDIASFTNISEAMDPEKLVGHLGEYLQVLSEQILASGGTVDKYIGDAIMAFWGAPLELPAHALAACTAALRNQQILKELRERWEREGKPPFQARIGINTGEVVVGNIGSAKRLNYTVIGDAVNLASRLEGLNKYYGTQTLIGESTYEEAKAGIVARPLDWVSVKGKNTGVLVYELLGLNSETSSEMEELAEKFGQALHAYRRQDWTEALRGFDALLVLWPEDAPAQLMKRRCELYRQQPPASGWDGVHHMESK